MVHCILIMCVLLAVPIDKNKQKKVNLYWLSFVVLTVFSALRYGFGNDYFSYKKIFDSIHGKGDAGIATYYEKQLLFTIFNKISPSFYFFIGLTSVCFLITVYFLIYKNCYKKYRWLAVAVFLINPYLFLINLSSIRQCMAMVLFIVAVDFAYKKNFIVYILLIAAATLFHTSAIILLPVYFILNEKPVGNIMILFIVGVVCFLLLTPNFLKELIEKVIRAIFHETNYDLYLNGENSFRATILSSVYFFYVLFNIKYLNGKNLVYAKLYLLGTIFNILAFRFSMLTRITMYFDIFSVVVIPCLFEESLTSERSQMIHIKRKGENLYALMNRYMFPCLIFVIYALRYYSFFTNPLWESFRVYRTIFSAR